MKLPLGRVAEFASAQGSFPEDAIAAGYSIDSRTLRPGELFFAVKGERLDGHDFVEAALAAGACAAVVRQDLVARFAGRGRVMAVPDTLEALQTLGSAVRKVWGKPLIAVTGSVGKTTTKEAIAHLLGVRFRVLKSEGNLNNQFGLPLQLLRLEAEHDLAVVELGMSRAGEIAALARLARPEIGVVTGVAAVHLEFFSSVAEIARAKYELIAELPPKGTAVLNADDEHVIRFGRDFPGTVVTYGLHHPADVRAEAVEDRGLEGSSFKLVVGSRRLPVTLPLLGAHNVSNALAAVAVALECEVPIDDAAAALPTLQAGERRGQVLEVGETTVINDCYNSNPRALDAMVDALAAMPAQRRIVIAGEMLELGPTAEDLHRRCGVHMAGQGIDVLVGVRGHACSMVQAAAEAGLNARFLETPEEAGEWLARETGAGDLVLLKASRGVRLEHALEIWKSRLQTAAASTH